MRSLLTAGTPGYHIRIAVAWAAGILTVSYMLALSLYRRSESVAARTTKHETRFDLAARISARR